MADRTEPRPMKRKNSMRNRDPRPDIAEKAALAYLLFGEMLPDNGERLVRLMEEHRPKEQNNDQKP